MGVNLDEDDGSTSGLLEDLCKCNNLNGVRDLEAAMHSQNKESCVEFTSYLDLESLNVLGLNPRDEELDSLLLQTVGVPFRVKSWLGG